MKTRYTCHTEPEANKQAKNIRNSTAVNEYMLSEVMYRDK